MKELVQFHLEDGGTVDVEVDDQDPGFDRVSRIDDAMVKAATSFDAALDRVCSAAQIALEKLRGAEPDELQVEFGIRLNAHAGAVIAATEAEGHLRVTLTWKKQVA
jgi:hypothetical protein